MSLAGERPRTPAVAMLRTDRLGVLLTGNFLSAAGTFVHITVASWLMYQMTRSSTMVGLLTVAQYAPMVALTLPAGMVADHRERRRLLIEIQLAMMVAAGSLAALVMLDVVSVWALFVVTVLLGVGSAFGGPSWIAFIGDIAPPDRVLLTFSLNSVSFHLAAALGPPIGTLLLRVAGPGAAFTANAVSYLAVVAGIAAVPRRPWSRTPFPGVRRSMGELYTFVRTSQRSRRLLVTSAVVSVLAFGLPAVLPAFATEVLGGGSGSYGSLMGAMGAGSLSGAVVMGVLSSRVTRRTIIVAGAWLVGAGALALGTTSLMSPALAGMWALGTGQLMLLVTSRTIIQMDAPEPLRARAVGLWFVFSVGAGPLGGALLGWSADLFGVATAVRAIALYGPLLAVALTIAAYTRVGRLRRAAATTGP